MKEKPIKRLLKPPNRSFFLFGPRGVGKTTWLKSVLPDAIYFNLLEASLFLELSQNPGHLGPMIGERPENSWIVVDEIQKIPELLDEVHRLIETKGWHFALCGSSARKLRRGGVNLLGGRAITRYLDAFSFKELKKGFDVKFSLQWGFCHMSSLTGKTPPIS